jgi:hypothetical protein
LESVLTIIENCGVTPHKLFKKQHPKKVGKFMEYKEYDFVNEKIKKLNHNCNKQLK